MEDDNEDFDFDLDIDYDPSDETERVGFYEDEEDDQDWYHDRRGYDSDGLYPDSPEDY